MTRRIAVDFDNTLTEGDVEYWNGERPELDPEVGQALKNAYHDGHTVIIWTARPWSEASSIAAFMAYHELPYHAIRCEKGSADIYVDDKAVSPEVFSE